MPRSGRKNKSRTGGFANSSDVTLKDFANSDVGPGRSRVKKAVCSTLVRAVKEICMASPAEVTEEKDWFEKSLDEFTIDSEPENEEDEALRAVKPRRRRKTMSTSKAPEDDTGNVYPLDIWFILGAYIKPEDVSRFASICKGAYAVTQTSKFWFRLYRRYYFPVQTLPVRLQPECMERLYGLKACVVRSLFYCYPLFQERLVSRKDEDPHTLIKSTCSMLWHQKGRGVFHFFFKLKRYSDDDDDQWYKSPQPDLIEMLGDINANPDKGCRILQVTSVTPTNLPPTVLGQTLLACSSCLSTDLRSHCLRLIFGPAHAYHNHAGSGKLAFTHIPEGAIGVTLNSVVKMKVLDWWHPAYPHSRKEDKPNVVESSIALEDVFF